MKQPTNHTRWHCFNQAGKKIIKRFPIGFEPTSLDGHTSWVRGTGPHSPEAREKIMRHLETKVWNQPRSLETREKMRQAKLGVKFSKEHRQKLREAQQRLRDEKQARIQEAYRIAQEASKEYYARG